MAKKIKLEMTEAQFNAIISMTDTTSALIGGGDEEFDKECTKNVKLVDKMLKRNGYKRNYN